MKCSAFVFLSVLPLMVQSVSADETADTTTVTLQGLELNIPAAWQKVDHPSRMRLGTFQIPPVEGDEQPAELAVYSFPGGGGSVDANIRRWIGQFDARGRTSKVTQGRAGDHEYVVVDVSGTWQQPIGPPIRRQTRPVPNSRMLAVILMHNTGVFYLKLTGPAATVSAQADALRASFGGNAEQETERPD